MERVPLKSSIPERQDQEIEDILGKVPPVLAERWRQKTDNLSREGQLAELRRLYALRDKKIHSFVPGAQSPSSGEIVHTSPLAVRQLVEHVEKGANQCLGEGKSGRVLASIRNPSVCYKIFFPLDVQPLGTNSIALEADMQNTVWQEGERYGVRAPKYHYFISNETVRAIAMERLNAVSIEDVLWGREVLPNAFNIDVFSMALAQYMRFLNEKGIYHRDLHGGNVLIDTQTGMPYVIDFGHATRSIGGDDSVYQTEVIKAGRKLNVMLLSDPAQVQKLTADMQNYIRQHQGAV